MKKSSASRVVVDPGILSGKPVIKGTRLSVEFILELLSSGMSVADITHEYKQLKSEDIYAAITYAVKSLKHEEILIPRKTKGIASPA